MKQQEKQGIGGGIGEKKTHVPSSSPQSSQLGKTQSMLISETQ